MGGLRNQCWLRIKNKSRLARDPLFASLISTFFLLEPEPPNAHAEKYHREPKQDSHLR
jgi:hypothetical protein